MTPKEFVACHKEMLENIVEAPPVQIATTGRTDLEDFFQMSDLRSAKKLSHTPVLVFTQMGHNTVAVEIVTDPTKLLSYPDHTPAMMQWRGQYRSDFFQFSIRELRAYVQDHPKQPYQVF